MDKSATSASAPAGTLAGVSIQAARTGRHTVLEVDHATLTGNFRAAARLAGRADLLGVVKANAYGHGLVPVAHTLLAAGASHLGVATVAEGVALREAGITAPVLLLGGYLGDESLMVAGAGLTPALFSDELIDPLRRAARDLGKALPVHVKVDTGMGRIGFAPDAAVKAIQALLESPELRLEGVFTHFAEADLADSVSAEAQLARLGEVHRRLGPKAARIPLWHAANSAALMGGMAVDGEGPFPATLCRPGIMLYGHPPAEGFDISGAPELAPVATWKANVLQVKEVPEGTPISYGGTFVTRRKSRIATLPVGYADGLRRELSNTGHVLVRGVRAPIAGRVCMDMTMLDVTDIPGVRPGDEAVLMGRQDHQEITATEVAGQCGTIAYEILCGVSDRVPRSHLNLPDGTGDG